MLAPKAAVRCSGLSELSLLHGRGEAPQQLLYVSVICIEIAYGGVVYEHTAALGCRSAYIRVLVEEPCQLAAQPAELGRSVKLELVCL